MKTIGIILCLAVVCFASHAPTYKSSPHSSGGYHETYESTPPKYEFEYGVKDDHYNNYGHKEYRDGYTTGGEYHVALPDGRTQVVNYHVDDAYSGYVAQVTYTGEAKHPEPVHSAPSYHAPQPSYKPVYEPPSYHH